MKGLTPTQAKVLEFIAAFLHEHGYPPSFRDICAHMGAKSSNSAHDWLKALEAKKCIRRVPGAARALRLTPKGEHELDLITSERLARKAAAE